MARTTPVGSTTSLRKLRLRYGMPIKLHTEFDYRQGELEIILVGASSRRRVVTASFKVTFAGSSSEVGIIKR